MPEYTHRERLDRLEQVVHILAEDQVSLRELVSSLATETRKAFDKVAEMSAETGRQMRETEKRMRETDERIRETDLRFRATDERFQATDERFQATDERFRVTDERFRATSDRIDKLVVAIGEFIRRNN